MDPWLSRGTGNPWRSLDARGRLGPWLCRQGPSGHRGAINLRPGSSGPTKRDGERPGQKTATGVDRIRINGVGGRSGPGKRRPGAAGSRKTSTGAAGASPRGVD
eukprot:gene8970-biopygen22677